VNGVGTASYECGEHYSDDDPVRARFFASFAIGFLRLPFLTSNLLHLTSALLECATCGDNLWEEDLESVEALWFDQPSMVLLCEDCRGESDESEEICEDFGAGAALPGQMEIHVARV